VFFEDDLVIGLWDAFPLTQGHALLVPRRHVAEWFDATADEQRQLMLALQPARAAISALRHADGFNIGINVGTAAGQTVPHLHVHLIPRAHGDVADPRGGVRWILPDRAAWWNAR
jgi:diadenosine tetraphosphate (Ap4A) HIT family hydrolase